MLLQLMEEEFDDKKSSMVGIHQFILKLYLLVFYYGMNFY